MKKLSVFIFIALFAVSCGKDGIDGNAYLSFDWDWYVDSYQDNNSSTPSTVSENSNYSTSPGTFTFSYECSDGAGNYWGFDGSYRIQINEGAVAELFEDGADGEDNYYTLYLTGAGASLDVYKVMKVKKVSLSDNHKSGSYKKVNVGSVIEELIMLDNGNSLIVKKQKYLLIEK